jgi:hypothetical protein
MAAKKGFHRHRPRTTILIDLKFRFWLSGSRAGWKMIGHFSNLSSVTDKGQKYEEWMDGTWFSFQGMVPYLIQMIPHKISQINPAAHESRVEANSWRRRQS